MCVLHAYHDARNRLARMPVEVYYERRMQERFCTLDSCSAYVRDFAVALEDSRFYEHGWYSSKALRRCLRYNICHPGRRRGGSTITQQLAKNIYFSFEKTYSRKLSEWFVAKRLEEVLTKDQILELYLNIVFFGNDQYGICDAADFYFGKEPADLTVNQSLMLISILCMPVSANPLKHPETYLMRRRKALLSLVRSGHISLEEANQIIREYSGPMLDPQLRHDHVLDGEDRIPPMNEVYGFKRYLAPA